MTMFENENSVNNNSANAGNNKKTPWSMIVQVLIAALTALAGFLTGGNLS